MSGAEPTGSTSSILAGDNPSTDTWAATSTTNAPIARISTAVWTGSEMIVWGGYYDTGGRYNPSTDTWTATSTTNAPSGRSSQAAVWTASEMIVWGGVNVNNGTLLNTGGRYNPGTDTWTATNTANAPSAREYHTAIWTGNEMIVWGRADAGSPGTDTGGRYCAQFAPTPSPTPTPTATPTSTPRPTLTPRLASTPRRRPTPVPRP